MPPKTVKKAPAGAGVKKTVTKNATKSTKASTKAANSPSVKTEAEAIEKGQTSATLDATKVEEKPSEATVQPPSSVEVTAMDVEKSVDDVKAEKKETEAVKESTESTAGGSGASKEDDLKEESVKGKELDVEDTDVALQEVQENVGSAEENQIAGGEKAENDEVTAEEDQGGDAEGRGEYKEEVLLDEGEEEHPQHDEMPAPIKERRKQKEFEVFVGGLDKDANEEDLKKVFGEVGEIIEIRLAKNPHTQKNKGFAFIRFATVEQAKKAVAELKNPQVKGKRCGVTRSQDNETLYVRNISRSWTKDDLRNKLKEYGIEDVEELTLMDDPEHEGMNRGFAFLEFNTHLDATNAFKRLQKRDVFFGVDVSAKVAFAKSGIEPDEEIMAQVKSVFVDGLPAAWDEEHVKEKFKKYGEIENVQLARNMPSARRKDFGFINYTTREAALACIEGVNKNELAEGDKKVNIKATLRKPQQKGRSIKDPARVGYQTGYGSARGYSGSRGSRVPWGRSAGVHSGSRFDVRGARDFLGGRDHFRGSRDYSDRGRHLPSSGRMYDRRPTAANYYGEEDELYIQRQGRTSSRSAAAIPRRPAYRDYGYEADYYSEAVPQSHSRIPSRRSAYDEDGYGYHMDEVSAYHDAPVRNYDAVSVPKRPYSDLDPELSYAGPPTRRQRTHLDHDLGAGPVGGSRAGGMEGVSYPPIYSSRNVGGYGQRGAPGSYY
ncbi:uncharacterized protein LOC131034621 [Cryptomeria japonica]|uniref:uncharacterized protein LOC131034621 n=1 Tax=Cryptomeria japonica TaxID=3369 RepID=UPI0025ABAEA6|nr:uncharacterized protein LOC131034621 [Cryptomeria japonica]